MLNDGLPFLRRTAPQLTGRRAYRLVAAGQVREVLRGVYVDREAADDLPTRARSVALVLPEGAVLCRGTVAWLIGVGDVRLPGEQHTLPAVECMLPTGRTPVRRPGLRCYAAPMGPQDVVMQAGLPRTSNLRTAMDLARWLPRPMALAALDAMASRGLLDLDVAAGEIERFAGDPGVVQARELIAWTEPLTESFGESWLRLRILDAGFARPTAQVSVRDRRGRSVYRLDLGFEEAMVGAEYDGDEHHGSAEAQRADELRRHRLRREFGWTVVGFHRGHVWGRSMDVERVVGELLGVEAAIGRRRW